MQEFINFRRILRMKHLNRRDSERSKGILCDQKMESFDDSIFSLSDECLRFFTMKKITFGVEEKENSSQKENINDYQSKKK